MSLTLPMDEHTTSSNRDVHDLQRKKRMQIHESPSPNIYASRMKSSPSVDSLLKTHVMSQLGPRLGVDETATLSVMEENESDNMHANHTIGMHSLSNADLSTLSLNPRLGATSVPRPFQGDPSSLLSAAAARLTTTCNSVLHALNTGDFPPQLSPRPPGPVAEVSQQLLSQGLAGIDAEIQASLPRYACSSIREIYRSQCPEFRVRRPAAGRTAPVIVERVCVATGVGALDTVSGSSEDGAAVCHASENTTETNTDSEAEDLLAVYARHWEPLSPSDSLPCSCQCCAAMPLFPAPPAPLAIKAHRAALALAWMLRAVLAARAGAHAEALSHAGRSLRHGDDDVAYNTMAFSLSALGAFEHVGDCAERALAINPENDAAWGHRGVAHLHYGRDQAAVDDCRAALLLNPTNVEARHNMQTALDRMRARKPADTNAVDSLEKTNARKYTDQDASNKATDDKENGVRHDSGEEELEAGTSSSTHEDTNTSQLRGDNAAAAELERKPTESKSLFGNVQQQNFLLLGTTAGKAIQQ